METITQGVAIATPHRVLSPEKGSTPRYSIPFFQIIKRGTVIGDEVLESKCQSPMIRSRFANMQSVPPETLKIKETRGDVGSDGKVQHSPVSSGTLIPLYVSRELRRVPPAPLGRSSPDWAREVRLFVALRDTAFPDGFGFPRSHPDVAQRYYPELFKQYFPDGLPAQGLAY